MKVFAHHDEKGNVHSVVAIDGPDDMGLALTPQAGQMVSELEDVKVRSAVDADALAELVKGRRLDVKPSRGKLVKSGG